MRELPNSLALSGTPANLASDRTAFRSLASSFLMTAFLPSHPAFPVAASSELRSLAAVMDFLVQGRIAAAADVVAQRWRALEVASTEGWQVARHLELLPPAGVSSVPSNLRAAAVRQFRAEQRACPPRPGAPPPRRPPWQPNPQRGPPFPQQGNPPPPAALFALPQNRADVRDPAAARWQQQRRGRGGGRGRGRGQGRA